MDTMSFICPVCNKSFEKTIYEYTRIKKRVGESYIPKCSRKCISDNKTNTQTFECNCKQCDKKITRNNGELKKNINANFFCSKSCAGTYNSQRKTKGTRISKLELFLQEKLIQLYPNLEFHFNRKDTINSELDIYLPELRLAFELNGIFHYEPIYGNDKFEKIVNKDKQKVRICEEKGIELCIIDSSRHSYVTKKSSQIYIDIVISIINQNLPRLKNAL